MSKAPGFFWYVKDWLSDPQLQMVSHSTKGIWIDLLCYMWDAPVRGELTATREQLRRLVHANEEDMNRFFDEVEMSRFCHAVTECSGKVTLQNRRMYREEKAKNDHALRQQKYRDKKNSDAKVTPPSSFAFSTPLKEKREKKTALTDDEWIETLKKNPAYQGLNIDVVKGKMEVWCTTNGKKPTRKRLLNWLNREDRPLAPSATGGNGYMNSEEKERQRMAELAKKVKERDSADSLGHREA